MFLPAITSLAEGGHDIPVVDPSSAGSLALPLVLVVALPAFGAAFLLLGGRRTDAFGHLRRLRDRRRLVHLLTVAVHRDPRARCRRPSDQPDPLDVVQRRGLDRRSSGCCYDPLSALFLLLITGVGGLIHIYSIGYMAAGRTSPAVLRLPEPLRRLDARAGPRIGLRRCLPRLGGRRPHVVPADRVLAVQALGRGRRQEGVRDQPRR